MKITEIALDLTVLTDIQKSELKDIVNSKCLTKDWTEEHFNIGNLHYLDYEIADEFGMGYYFKLADRVRPKKKLVSYAKFKTIVSSC